MAMQAKRIEPDTILNMTIKGEHLSTTQEVYVTEVGSTLFDRVVVKAEHANGKWTRVLLANTPNATTFKDIGSTSGMKFSFS